jgi:hypothetical protein
VAARAVLLAMAALFLLLGMFVPFWLLPGVVGVAGFWALRRGRAWLSVGPRWPLLLTGGLLVAGGIALGAYAVAELHLLDPQRDRGGALAWVVNMGGGGVLVLAGLSVMVARPVQQAG